MVCGHGGDAAQAPPNTMRAFRAAVDSGVRCLEVPRPDLTLVLTPSSAVAARVYHHGVEFPGLRQTLGA